MLDIMKSLEGQVRSWNVLSTKRLAARGKAQKSFKEGNVSFMILFFSLLVCLVIFK